MGREGSTLTPGQAVGAGLLLLVVSLLVVLGGGLPTREVGTPPSARDMHEDFKSSVDFSYVGDEGWSELKYAEVGRVYALLDRHPSDVVAIRSGRWSESSTWSTGLPPKVGSSVWIPAELEVEVDTRLAVQGPEFVRVDGILRFSSTRDTRLGVETVVVTHSGGLFIGSESTRVATDVQAELVFDRPAQRDLARDPMDMTGGLLVTGRLAAFGALKQGVATPKDALKRGAEYLAFDRIPEGWRVGDRLLIPGVDATEVRDEVVAITALDPRGGRVELDKALQYDHEGPIPALVPVGNLSRNVVFRSATPSDPGRRAHVMVVHRQGGVVVDSVRFEELGRTRADRVATRPKMDTEGSLVPGSDANTIGRYVLHFHNRMGARPSESQRVSHCVLEGGPRHGLVNHGGHVIARDNVSHRIAGSHFFGENGTEMGIFSGNLAVRSDGSGDEDLKSRMYTFDFGHGGHGFWLEGGGVLLEKNYAFGHAGSAFSVFSRPLQEPAGTPTFQARNLSSRFSGAADWEAALSVDEVPFAALGNVAAASRAGFEVWYHKRVPRNTRHEVYSVLDGGVFWEMREAPLSIAYSHFVEVRNLRLFGGTRSDRVGIRTNFESTDLKLENLEVRGFGAGMLVPYFGDTEIRGGRFANARNFVVYSPIAWGRRVRIDGVERLAAEGPWRSRYHVALYRPRERGPRNSRYLYFHNLFLADSIELDGERVYFDDQSGDAVPFPDGGPARLMGLTSAQIQRQYGLATGGALAGPDAEVRRGVRGLVGKPPTMRSEVEPLFAEAGNNALSFRGYRLPDGREVEVDLSREPEGWGLIPVPEITPPQHLLALVDHTPPRLVLDERFPNSICPQDLERGVLVAGRLRDAVGDATGDHKFRRIVYDYEYVDPQTVAYRVDLSDSAGNSTSTTLRLQVDADTPCRGPNVDHYLQRSG